MASDREIWHVAEKDNMFSKSWGSGRVIWHVAGKARGSVKYG